VILTTAYPDFALQGYEMDVVDYLLKPFSFSRFERAVKKIRSISGAEQSTLASQPSQLLSPEKDDFIFVKSDTRMIKVMLDSIYYLEGSGNYVTIHTTKGKVMVLQNLRKFEDQLRPYKFIRIHKSFIISLNYVDVIERASVRVHTFDLPIGETYREDFHNFIDKQYRNF
jgi:DNA-binding LytR/AlgR family response regulator